MESFEHDEPSGFGYFKIGNCYNDLDDIKKAILYYTKAIQNDPELDEAHMELALLYDDEGKMHQALYHAEMASKLDPENADYLLYKAEIYAHAGLLDEAIEYFNDLLDLGLSAPEIYSEYAEVLFDMEEVEQGMDLLYKGIELNPEDVELRCRLGGYLWALNEFDEARIYLKQALDIDPNCGLVFFDLFPKFENDSKLLHLLKAKGSLR